MLKKKSMIAFIAVLLIVVLPIVLYIGGRLYNTDEKYYESAWGIDMPQLKLEYSKGDIGWFGEGTEYAVYKLDEEPKQLNGYLKDNKDNAFEQNVNNALTKLQISAENLPAWGEDYQWGMLQNKSDDLLYIIYIPSTMQLILVRDIR